MNRVILLHRSVDGVVCDKTVVYKWCRYLVGAMSLHSAAMMLQWERLIRLLLDTGSTAHPV